MSLSNGALRAIARYRKSAVHRRSAGCCRFTPSCSHYAEEALRRRSLPLALVLVAWRLLRCTPLTPRGTVDHVGPRRPRRSLRVLAVLALSGLTTFLVVTTASAAAGVPLLAGGSTTSGGCDAFVGGVPIGALDVDHPLQVHKGQRIVVTGLAPLSVRNLPATAKIASTTDVEIHFVVGLATTTLHEPATGQRFQRSVNVDTYLKYGSGVYRVDVHSVASQSWDCSATFYVELNGSKLAAEAAIVVGGIGVVGVVLAGGTKPPLPEPDMGGTYDPGIAPDALDRAQQQDHQRDVLANVAAEGAWGCLAFLFYLLMTQGAGFWLALPVAAAGRRRVWVRGRVVLGFVSGVVAGVGATVALQQYGAFPLTRTNVVMAPLLMGVLGAVRGWRGRAWKVRA